MIRAKWMRLIVRDLADVLRWADSQNARRIDQFRYRLIHGREIVSFRLVPAYPIEIGTRDILVVAHARGSLRRVLAHRLRFAANRTAIALKAVFSRPRLAAPTAPARTAELRRLPHAG